MNMPIVLVDNEEFFGLKMVMEFKGYTDEAL